MCGIAGIYKAVAGVDLAVTAYTMADTLRHRGPDDAGVWCDAQHGLALAHRRLAIIDLTPQGHQPMISQSGRYVLVFNGEIYNFEVIRRELNAQGLAPPWRGHADTEVLLAAIEAWGIEAALQRSVGMFAFALWDKHAAVLTLARDRLGEKPLYYGATPAGFAFASELKAIRALLRTAPEIDRAALARFMQFGYTAAPLSIYQGIYKLPPAHFIHISNDKIGAPQAYWRFPDAQCALAAQIARARDEELIALLNERLKTAVGQQMMADVPLGAFLSGGVDSSLIVALMQAQSARPVRTFTIGFNDPQFNEAPFARAVARHLGTEHTELYVGEAQAREVIPRLPQIFDEPFADSSQIPTVLVAQLTRAHVTVSLSGDGGDELFAGYPRYRLAARLWRTFTLMPEGLRATVARALEFPDAQAWDRLLKVCGLASRRGALNGHKLHRLAHLVKAKSLSEMYLRLVTQWPADSGVVLGADESAPPQNNIWPAQGTPIEQMRRCDALTYLPDDILVKVDRAAMAASLESRAPFLDHRVVELAFALPQRVLLRHHTSKWVLREILYRQVPRALIERPKCGFAAPIGAWLRGPLRAWAADLLEPARLRAEGHLDAAQISAAWKAHIQGTGDRSPYLWNALMFQAWLAQTD